MPEALYDKIGTHYDSTRRADPALVARLLALLEPELDGRYLDVACGSGNYTAALAGQGVALTGVDASAEMLRQARRKYPVAASWVQGLAQRLPFPDNSFAGAVTTNAVHHFADLAAAFREVSRVLQPGGRYVVLLALQEQVAQYWLREYFPGMIRRSAAQLPTQAQLQAALVSADLQQIKQEPYFIANDLQDLFLYAGKHNPTLYLDPTVRANISSFQLPDVQEEISAGLAQLAADLRRERLPTKLVPYLTLPAGDYTFLAVRKPTGLSLGEMDRSCRQTHLR